MALYKYVYDYDYDYGYRWACKLSRPMSSLWPLQYTIANCCLWDWNGISASVSRL